MTSQLSILKYTGIHEDLENSCSIGLSLRKEMGITPSAEEHLGLPQNLRWSSLRQKFTARSC